MGERFVFPALDALLLFFFLNLACQPLIDPDFGWHLRTGLDLLAHGWVLPRTDPYSHTMPDWPWVEHAWLTDAVIGLIYTGLQPIGTLGVIAFFAAVITAAFGMASGIERTEWTPRLAAMTIAAWVALPFLGARTQMVSLLGLTFLLYLWRCYCCGRLSHLWGLAPVFLLWANVHGGFTAGLLTLTLIVGVSALVRLARRPQGTSSDEPVLSWPQIGHLLLVLIASSALTLVNPYGWRLHEEIYDSLNDAFMLTTLHEWQPVSLQHRAGRTFVVYTACLSILVALFYRRVQPVRWALLAVFLGMALRHWRHVPLFLLISLPLATEMIAAASREVSIRAPAIRRHPKRWLLAAALLLGVVMVQLGPDHLKRVVLCGIAPADFFRETEYPIEAVQWVQSHRTQVGTRVYNEYGWGGFLLWWLPEERIFIDGRMPAWRIGDRWIFYDYLALSHRDSPELGVLGKYNVDWAMIDRRHPLVPLLAANPQWRLVYEDEKTAVYAKRSHTES
jgi:hypothetical protein